MEEGAGGLRWWGLLEGKDGRKRGEGTGSKAVEYGGRLPGSAWEVGDAMENGRDAADRGSRAVECGGHLPGSAREVGDAAENGRDAADHGSRAVECGGCLPRSAREVGDAVDNGRDADHLAIHKDADNVVGQHFLSTYGGIQAISSAVGRGIDAKFVSVADAASITENDVASQVNHSIHEIDMIGSTTGVDRRNDSETIGVDRTFYEINEMYIVNKQNEEINAGTSSCKISAVQSTSSIEETEETEEEEDIEGSIANLASDNDDIVTTLTIQDSEKESPIEDGDPSYLAVTSEKLQDVPASVLPAEPEDDVRFSSEISEYEMQTLNVVSLASYAIGGGISKQKDIVSELDDIAVTEEDVMTNTIGRNETSEDNPVKVDEFGLSCQDNKQTKIGERHSANDHEIELNQQKKLMVTNPIENFPIIVEPVESFTEKSVGTPDTVQPKHQLDSTPDHRAIPKEANNVGPYYPSTEISSSMVLPHEEGGTNTLGWKGTLLKYSISPPASMDNTYLMSKFLLLHSLDTTLDVVPKNLRLAFDKHVNGIGSYIKDDVEYVQVISKILIPELTPKYDFSEMFSDDLVLKIEEANRVASSYREKELTLYDRQIILGALDQLPIIPAQIESLVMQINLQLETVKKFDENEKEPDENSHGKNEDGREDEKLEKEKNSLWLHVMRLLVSGGIVVAMVSSGGNN